MKKIAFFLWLCATGFWAQAQYTIPQGIGNQPATMVTVGGGLTVRGGVVFFDYIDTTTANLGPYVKYTSGIVILTGTKLWKRNECRTQWLLLATGATGTVSNEITGELIAVSTAITAVLAQIPLTGTLKLLKNGVRLPPYKYSLTGATILLMDARTINDVFQADYKF